MSQTSYSAAIPANKVGLLADMGEHDIMSKTNQTVAMLVGHYINTGASSELCAAPAASTDVTAKSGGIVVSSQDQECTTESSPSVPAGKQVNMLKKGRIWCAVEDAGNYTQDMQASVRYAGSGVKGIIVCTPVSMETALLPNSKILQILNGLALVEVNNV